MTINTRNGTAGRYRGKRFTRKCIGGTNLVFSIYIYTWDNSKNNEVTIATFTDETAIKIYNDIQETIVKLQTAIQQIN